MKKILTAVLLAVALVAPAFASDTDLELIPKIGYLFSPEVTWKADGRSVSDSKDSALLEDFPAPDTASRGLSAYQKYELEPEP